MADFSGNSGPSVAGVERREPPENRAGGSLWPTTSQGLARSSVRLQFWSCPSGPFLRNYRPNSGSSGQSITSSGGIVMRGLLATGLLLAVLSGCAPGPSWTGPMGPPVTVLHDNPMLLPITNAECAWETVVDVVDDYFKIEREEPVRVAGDILTEGRLDTYPKVAATIFEPWHPDSAGRQERIESTLQSMRRRAVVRVMPTEGGYWVDVAVFKELEDVRRPEHATAGAATFRYDASLTRVVNPVGGQQVNEGWIPQGRDLALEQRILGHLHQRCGQLGVPLLSPVVRGNDQ